MQKLNVKRQLRKSLVDVFNNKISDFWRKLSFGKKDNLADFISEILTGGELRK